MTTENPDSKPEKARFTLRVAPELLARLHAVAAGDGVSVADWLRLLIGKELHLRASTRKGA